MKRATSAGQYSRSHSDVCVSGIIRELFFFLRSSACMDCARQLFFSVAPEVRFHDVAQPVSAGHKCSGKAVSTMRVFSVRVTIVINHILAECVRRECFASAPFFALPFALFSPLFVVSVQVSGGVFCPRSKKGVPKLLLTPESSNRSVLELVLHASYCSNNRSVRPRERWVYKRVRHIAKA